MRERLVAAFVGLTVVVVALYGIPRAYFLADLVRSDEQARVDRVADLTADALDQRLAAKGSITAEVLQGLAGEGEWISVTRDGVTVSWSDGSTPAKGDITATQDLAGGGTVTVAREEDVVDGAIADALLPLVLLGLFLVVLAGGAGYLIARRLARPFQNLASAARELGAGRLQQEIPGSRVPEADAIATALRTSGANLEALLRHERELAVHASHELRTPVTALRLELEDIALWKETPPKVVEALHHATGELDRLSAAIAALLAGAREQLAATAIDLDLDALVADTTTRLRDAGLRVTHQRSGTLPTRLDPQPVIRLLAQLVSDSGARGGEVRVSTADKDSHYEVQVAAGTSAGTPSQETQDLAGSLGGQVSTDPEGAWILRLPKHALAGKRR